MAGDVVPRSISATYSNKRTRPYEGGEHEAAWHTSHEIIQYEIVTATVILHCPSLHLVGIAPSSSVDTIV